MLARNRPACVAGQVGEAEFRTESRRFSVSTPVETGPGGEVRITKTRSARKRKKWVRVGCWGVVFFAPRSWVRMTGMVGAHTISFVARSHFDLSSEPLAVEAELIVDGTPGHRTLAGLWRITGANEVRTVAWSIPWRDLGYLDYATVGAAMQGVVRHKKEIADLRSQMGLPGNVGPYWQASVGSANFTVQYRPEQKTVVVGAKEGDLSRINLCLSPQIARLVGRKINAQSRKLGIWLFRDLVKWERLK